MTRHDLIHRKLPLLCLVLSLVIFTISLANLGGTGNLERAVSRTEDKAKERIEALDELIPRLLDLGYEFVSVSELLQ